MENSQNSLFGSELIFSPGLNDKIFGNASRQNLGFVEINKTSIDFDFLIGDSTYHATPVKSELPMKRRSTINLDFTSQKKKKKQQLIQNLEASILHWSDSKLSKFFKK